MIKVKDNYTILFIGDSITDVKFNKQQNHILQGKNIYALQVAKALKKKHSNLKFIYKGIASNRTYHVYDRLTKDCISLNPDIIVMLIGVNDAWENYVPEEYPPLLRPMEPHIKEIYRRINAELPETEVILLMPFMIDTVEGKFPFHKVLDEYIAILKRCAKGYGFNIIDLQSVFNKAQETTKPELLATDGIHPTDLGHSVIAQELLMIMQ